MKVILLKDVARIGKKGEVKEVPSGHALNLLIPRKLAEPAIPENLKKLRERQSKQADSVAHTEESFADALRTLATIKVELTAPANEQGHLFKGVKATDIVERLIELKIAISIENIKLSEPIKSLGDHEIALASEKQHGSFILSIIKK